MNSCPTITDNHNVSKYITRVKLNHVIRIACDIVQQESSEDNGARLGVLTMTNSDTLPLTYAEHKL